MRRRMQLAIAGCLVAVLVGTGCAPWRPEPRSDSGPPPPPSGDAPCDDIAHMAPLRSAPVTGVTVLTVLGLLALFAVGIAPSMEGMN